MYDALNILPFGILRINTVHLLGYRKFFVFCRLLQSGIMQKSSSAENITHVTAVTNEKIKYSRFIRGFMFHLSLWFKSNTFFSFILPAARQHLYASLLVIITLRFTCSERKICSTIKKSQDIMNMIVE